MDRENMKLSWFGSGRHVCHLPHSIAHSPISADFSPQYTVCHPLCMSLLTGHYLDCAWITTAAFVLGVFAVTFRIDKDESKLNIR